MLVLKNLRSTAHQVGMSLMLIVLNNRSHAASALRPPILGYTSWWQTNFAPLINQLFSTGPGSPTTQTVTLKEKLKLSSDCSSK